MKLIGSQQPGWFRLKSRVRETHGASKVLRRAGRIYRECVCSVGYFLRHEHSAACDRSGTLAATVDGWPARVDHVWFGGEPITETEALSLMGVENMYV